MVDAARRASADGSRRSFRFSDTRGRIAKISRACRSPPSSSPIFSAPPGVNRVLTMDLHAQQVQGFFDIPVDHLYSLPVLIQYLRKKLTRKTVGGLAGRRRLKMACAYSQALGATWRSWPSSARARPKPKALYLIGDVEGLRCPPGGRSHRDRRHADFGREAVEKERCARYLRRAWPTPFWSMWRFARLQKSQIKELITTNSMPVRTVEGFTTTVLCVSELSGKASSEFITTNLFRRFSRSTATK